MGFDWPRDFFYGKKIPKAFQSPLLVVSTQPTCEHGVEWWTLGRVCPQIHVFEPLPHPKTEGEIGANFLFPDAKFFPWAVQKVMIASDACFVYFCEPWPTFWTGLYCPLKRLKVGWGPPLWVAGGILMTLEPIFLVFCRLWLKGDAGMCANNSLVG